MAHIINASTFMSGSGDRVEQATPLIKIDSDGKITAEAVQKEGYVKGGTKTASKQLDTAAGGNITPSKEEQTPARAGEFLKGDLVVLPIPSEYIIPKGTDTLTKNGEFNVRELEKVHVAVDKGVDAPDVPQAVPSITVSDNGLITATAVQDGGLVPSGTKTTTKQLTTQEGKTITPTESEQTAVEDNRYTTGAVKVAPIPSEYRVGDEIAAQETLIADIEELVAKVGGGTSEPDTDLEDALITHQFEKESYSNDRITSVGYGAFYGVSKLKSLDLPNVTSIDGYALFNCTSLIALNAPLLKSVGPYAIYKVALPVIDFPELETMTTYSFSAITMPCVVRLPKANTVGNSSFRNSIGITIADFTACTKIHSYAFSLCENLSALILRNSDTMCTLQSTNAFSNTKIAKGTGYVYFPRVFLSDNDASSDYRRMTNWSTLAAQFRVLEEYTVDGTTTGELDESKI